MYAIAGIGILLIILFRFFGVIKDFDMEYVYLILMLFALIIFPIVGEFSYGNFKFKSNIGPADKKDIEKEEEEEKKELNSNSEKKNLSATEIKDIKQKMLEQYCQEINVNSKMKDNPPRLNQTKFLPLLTQSPISRYITLF